MKKKVYYLILLSIIILGALLRFYLISDYSLWNDELESLRISKVANISELLQRSIKDDVHPPLYQIILYCVIRTFGDSEFALRLPSAIAGILSIFFIALLGKKLFSESIALTSASLLAFIWTPIYYSVEARSYSILLLLSIWQAILFFEMFKGLGNREKSFNFYLSLLFLNSLALAYTHYFGLLLALLSNLFILIIAMKRKSKLITFLLFNALFILAYLPFINIILNHFKNASSWIKEPHIADFALFLFFASGYSFFLITCCFLLLLFYFSKKKGKGKPVHNFNVIALLLWLFVPYLIAFFYSLAFTPILSQRNLIILLPAAYLLFAYFISSLFKNTYSIIIIALILIFNLFFFSTYFDLYKEKVGIFGFEITIPHKQESRKAMLFFKNELQEYSDYEVFASVYFKEYIQYYFEKESIDLKSFEIIRLEKDTVKLNEIEKGFILISLHAEPEEKLIQYIEKRFAKIRYKEFCGAKVFVFKKNF